MKFFVTGISTEVGKTVCSAILTEALEADYWKPVQAGDLEYGDADKVRNWVSNAETVVHPNSIALRFPMSPHASAAREGVPCHVGLIDEPATDRHLVIEGAGGLLVPLNEEETIADLIRPDYQVVLVSRHYLGSINHSLLSAEFLKQLGHSPWIVFSGDENPGTESAITGMTGLPVIGRIRDEAVIDATVVREYAESWRPRLEELMAAI